ncbi:MAG: hypothetical protein M1829_005433 [Trizodia sp. TS-e1964]|nr:MAG: hypothetical protein M1829_005433 [Trizodia sp. TS-e1964]
MDTTTTAVPPEAPLHAEKESLALHPHSADTTSAVPSLNEKAAERKLATDGDGLPASKALADDAASDEEIEYPKGLKLFLILLALSLAVFLVALDQTIIATAIPRITDEFKALEDVGWYGSAYLLCTCAFQLIFGKFYTFFSIKWTFLSAIGIFELGSLICGVAPNSTCLIIGRAIAGLGCAGIFSGALIIIANSVPLVNRPTYSGVVGAMYGLASVAGPLLGGVFTDKVTWRWCFYINLPIGAVTVISMVFFFHPQQPKRAKTLTLKEKLSNFDPIGTALFIPAIICLLLALQWGGQKYEWNNGRIIALFVIAGLLIAGFVAVQIWKQDMATVPPRILKQRSVFFALWYSACLGSAFFIMIFYIPIWFQAVKGVSAVDSGIRNLPMILGVVIFSIVGGGLTTVIGYYAPFMILGSVLISVGAGLLTTFAVDTGSDKWIGYQAIFGLGIGLGIQLPLIAVQAVLSLDDVPIGTAVIVFGQSLGGALFISIAQNIFTNKLAEGIRASIPDLDPAIIINSGATNFRSEALIAPYIDTVTELYNSALTKTYYVSVAMACLSMVGALGVEWKSVKGKKIEMAAA